MKKKNFLFDRLAVIRSLFKDEITPYYKAKNNKKIFKDFNFNFIDFIQEHLKFLPK